MEGPLRPEDGARFRATIQPLERGCRAGFYLLLEVGGEIVTEQGDVQLFPNDAAALKWLHAQAAARGFKSIEVETGKADPRLWLQEFEPI